jgi:hypothetical protein
MSDSKLKARDIIAGWPRGKSNSQPYVPESDAIQFSFFGRSSWCPSDLYDLRWGIAYSIRYHREQSAMLDKHRSEYRRPTAAWLARKILATGGLVIATCGETPDTITLGEDSGPWRFEGPKKKSAVEEVEEYMRESERQLLGRFL